MAITKFKDSEDEADDDEINYMDDVEKPKWYDELAEEPFKFEESSEHSILSHRIEAQKILDDAVKNFQNKLSKAPKSSELGWIYTVLQKGAAGDKMAAMILNVQNSPTCNLNYINSLIGLVKPSKKKQCLQTIDNLVDLYLEDLLPPGRKLRPFGKHPFSMLSSLGAGRRPRLTAWLFESQLKESFSAFISALENVAKDAVEANREKAVSAIYKLLAGHPEMEEVLLRNLINKLGDPSQKVASRVIYCLTQLLKVHPNMKKVVMDHVEKLIFRPNLGARVQYYAICFLSQLIFYDGDVEIARGIIKIYFSFFKASIKKDEIDSRMMGALLTGVKRAYPFAKLDAGSLSEHIDTLYKLVHISSFTISLHALCLLQQVSTQSEDRFYCALYKKLLDPKLVSTTHQAIFINLVFKALSKDENHQRVAAIIKRLLQVCLQLPVPFLCGVLYMISQITNRSAGVRLLENKANHFAKLEEFESDDEEKFFDADKLDKKKGQKEEKGEKKSSEGWTFVSGSKQKSRLTAYSSEARNPAFCKAETSAYFELLHLTNHFHPTVALFSQKILNNELIVYTGDPLTDFTILRFLERFVFKNPKTTSLRDDGSIKGPDPRLAPRKYYKPSGSKALSVSTPAYIKQQPANVPVDETFLFRYLKERADVMASKNDKQANEDGEESDVESVASEEFDEMLSKMMGLKNYKNIDFEAEIGNQLKKKDPKSRQGKNNSENDENESDEDETEEDEDDGEVENDDLSDDAGSILEESDEEPVSSKGSKDGKKKKSKEMDDLFVPAEEFAELLEEAGNAKSGMAHSFSNPDNAAVKQLNWEADRDRWIRGTDRRKRKFRKQKPSSRKKLKK